ncbi:putative hydro-lyase [Thalassobacillus sp. CUG 92003]|uniref:putative hydro-lyase n=1 Tax=Thalassobacillus sp. CUG 92003 TaxID=2736641 RepID=UPI0015E62D28|nr:putative hydro-lyase [Thalassobacillus sp. CUG 92003]
MEPKQQRLMFRQQKQSETTSGLCDNYQQANMVVLPKDYAFAFLLFCMRNPKSCPLMDVLEPGEVTPAIADADVRSDLPKYRIYRDGEWTEDVLDIHAYWRDDFVTFLIGCSFTFEKALSDAGISLLHQELNRVVPMYKTTISLAQAGMFEGNMVVSMRAIKHEQVDKAVRISGEFTHAHGRPVHIGDPEAIGISSLMEPDYGEPAVGETQERTPVFWACGVTPQNAAAQAKAPIMITHAPGHMLITDERDPYYANS